MSREPDLLGQTVAGRSARQGGPDRLIRQPAPIADRQFEIEFLDPGAEVFVFTFG
jgi:hypothetical protein